MENAMGNNLLYILPEIFLVVAGFFVVLFGTVMKNQQRDIGLFSIFAFIAAAGILCYSGLTLPSKSIFYGMLNCDPLSAVIRFMIIVTMIVSLLLVMGDKFRDKSDVPEFYGLLFFMAVGFNVLVMSNNLLILYLALELVSLTSYVLVSLTKREFYSSEASLKYFLFGALSTAIMLFGISIIYGLTGSFDLADVFQKVASGSVEKGVLYIAFVFLLAGFGFKIAMAPFHMWAPDVYQGALTSVAALISVGPKLAAFAVFMRVFYAGIGDFGFNWYDLIGILAILTMTVGNVIAVAQDNVKRLLAYSSIAQAGYILIGFAVPTALGKESVMIYLIAYIFMNLGAFAIVISFINSIGSESIVDFRGLSKKVPVACFALTLFLLSLAGIPPMAGFLAKFYVFSAAIQGGKTYLAIAGVINSVIGVYYYAKIIKFMYFESARKEIDIVIHPAISAAVIISIIGTLLIGIYPSIFIDFASYAVGVF